MIQTNEVLRGRILSCLGGRYTIHADNLCYSCYAKGTLRHLGQKPQAGDEVLFLPGESFPDDGTPLPPSRENDGYLTEILPRKNALARPAVSNLDLLLIVSSARMPVPDLLFLDRLCVLCVQNKIEPIVICNKEDLAPRETKALCSLYQNAGIRAYSFCAEAPEKASLKLLSELLDGKITALAGNSGVGKTTLFNALFPTFKDETGVLSERIERGKNTTRATVLHPLSHSILENGTSGFFADTPGFSRLLFQKETMPSSEELACLFSEFTPFLANCRYSKCTHRSEEGCGVLEALHDGKIAQSRHESYCALYEEITALANDYKH